MALNREFVITMPTKKGPKDFVLFAGLLDLAHQQGLIAIETEILGQFCDPEEKSWVVAATGRFRTDAGEAVWTAHGDAAPWNSQMRGAELRHAETRAIARMLRCATNVGMTAFEEMGPDAEETAEGAGAASPGFRQQGGARRPNERVRPAESRGDRAANPAAPASAAPGEVAPVEFCEECGGQIEGIETKKGPVSVATMVAVSEQRWGRALCHPCGKKRMEVEPANLPGGELAAA